MKRFLIAWLGTVLACIILGIVAMVLLGAVIYDWYRGAVTVSLPPAQPLQKAYSGLRPAHPGMMHEPLSGRTQLHHG